MRRTLTVLLALTALPSVASAYEDKVVLTVDLGYAAALANDDLPTHAFSGGIGVDIGIRDAWAIRIRAAQSYHPSSEPLHVTIAGVEAVYLLDILEFVPFFGVGVDGIATVYDGDFGMDLGLHIVAGGDWLLARKWLLGLDVRAYFLPFSLADTGVDPVYLSASLESGRRVRAVLKRKKAGRSPPFFSQSTRFTRSGHRTTRCHCSCCRCSRQSRCRRCPCRRYTRRRCSRCCRPSRTGSASS